MGYNYRVGKQQGPRRPPKQADLVDLARDCIHVGRYRDTRHGAERREQREITLPEIRRVILTGWHEAAKDEYRPEYRAWNYAMRGLTVDGRRIRVAFTFEADTQGQLLLLITAIDLDA
jgi:hypothetical protein